MELSDNKYNKYALVREMMETALVISKFDPSCVSAFIEPVLKKKGIMLTGEGSSRIFPAKKTIYDNLISGAEIPVFTEGATQAGEYKLDNLAVFGASNSGQTKEVIRLISQLAENNHNTCFGLTAGSDTRLESICRATHILNCGKEDAVAATKSVVEQALFYDALLHGLYNNPMGKTDELADKFAETLQLTVETGITDMLAESEIIYFAGRNNGVAEELALKTNEITRKKSEYLEGTYAVHGIEEVMRKNETLVWISPFEEEIDKFDECLLKGAGVNIIAVSEKETKFPTLVIPATGKYRSYIELAAGWNLLVETGLKCGIDLDKPERARKVGNEF